MQAILGSDSSWDPDAEYASKVKVDPHDCLFLSEFNWQNDKTSSLWHDCWCNCNIKVEGGDR